MAASMRSAVKSTCRLSSHNLHLHHRPSHPHPHHPAIFIPTEVPSQTQPRTRPSTPTTTIAPHPIPAQSWPHVHKVIQPPTSTDDLAPARLHNLQIANNQQHAIATLFNNTDVLLVGVQPEGSPDPNKTKLGKTLRILQQRLPTLLQSPLPQEILAPNISLHLFPSTHPHLPTVSGRVAYNAALWTSPIAWNRVPIFSNVKIEILGERMTTEPVTFLPRRPGAIPEQLVVRWCEERKPTASTSTITDSNTIAKSLGLGRVIDDGKAFTGLFIFDFDQDGRILSHTIETAQERGSWEKGVGARFVGITDWLLGGIRDPGGTPAPCFDGLQKS